MASREGFIGEWGSRGWGEVVGRVGRVMFYRYLFEGCVMVWVYFRRWGLVWQGRGMRGGYGRRFCGV